MTPADPLADLGVRTGGDGGLLRIFSESADAIELCIFDANDPDWQLSSEPLSRDEKGVWQVESDALLPGARYGVRVSGPAHPANVFNPKTVLLDPYSRGLTRTQHDRWRSVVVDGGFDWAGTSAPRTAHDRTVIYETHVKGFSKLNPAVPVDLRGTYAGLAHEASIDYLTDLGVTAVELLPVQAFVSEQRLIKQGMVNYWGYNTVNFFSPHAAYATRRAQAEGPDAVLREFKGMVRLLHEAGLEVIMDVVYNHTAEEGLGGPRTSLRGIDNAGYYRLDDAGGYIDTTGCGNTIDFGYSAPQRLVLDSLRYWANEVQVDGFRFDLAATLGRDESGAFNPEHPLLLAILDDPELTGVKMIAEPWDVGMGGWQTGNFSEGWSEWNDRYRDRVRDFWLTDIASARQHGQAPIGIGQLATRLAGSANTFAEERGPLASINFVTAHDGFTMADLVSYNQKHNLGNGEDNRDGTDNNSSYNFGAEGETTDAVILKDRHQAMRTLLGTLLLSAGIPMINAGDEYGRSQSGNNNAYCHDDELTWLAWDRAPWQDSLTDVVKLLIRLRGQNPALRPIRYGRLGESTPGASRMDWYDAAGNTMNEQDWDSPGARTLQYLAASTPEFEPFNRILLVVHGLETEAAVTLPAHNDVSRYELLWDSADATQPSPDASGCAPGTALSLSGTSMRLFRAI